MPLGEFGARILTQRREGRRGGEAATETDRGCPQPQRYRPRRERQFCFRVPLLAKVLRLRTAAVRQFRLASKLRYCSAGCAKLQLSGIRSRKVGASLPCLLRSADVLTDFYFRLT